MDCWHFLVLNAATCSSLASPKSGLILSLSLTPDMLCYGCRQLVFCQVLRHTLVRPRQIQEGVLTEESDMLCFGCRQSVCSRAQPMCRWTSMALWLCLSRMTKPARHITGDPFSFI